MNGTGADEWRIQQLLRIRGVGPIGGRSASGDGWWDALYDDRHDDTNRPPPAPRLPDWRHGPATAPLGPAMPPPPGPPSTPAAPAAAPPPADGPTAEERWAWHRLYAWVRSRHVIGTVVALAPVFAGQSLATGWGHALTDCRVQESTGGAYTLAGLALAVTLTVARWRPRWYTTALACTALFGTAYMTRPFDLITFLTGVTP